DALNINKLDNSHIVDFDASSAGLSHTKILPVINHFLGHQDIDTAKNDSNKSVFDTPSEQVAVEVFVVAESDVIGESQFTQEEVSLDFVFGFPRTQRNKDSVMLVVDKIADRGNEEDGPDSRARGDIFYHSHRSVDRGNEKVDHDPGNISEIKGFRRRVRDLKKQHEIRQIRKRIRELELQREMRKENESRYVVQDDVNEDG
nr:RNA-directed DNA polymerase [Tanacetum cinerariifolium]